MLGESELKAQWRCPVPALITPTTEDPAVQRVLDRAAKGDRSVLPAAKQLLTDPRLQTAFGSVAEWAKRSLIRTAAGDNLVIAEAVNERLDEHVQGLLADGGSPPSFAEQMAARRVAHNWLTVHILETKRAGLGDGTAAAVVLDKQLGQAERRLHASLKSLATLQRIRQSVLVTQVRRAAPGPQIAPRAGDE